MPLSISIWSLLPKLLPLYFLIAIGATAARRLPIRRETLAALMLYTVTPVVVFWGALNAPLKPSLLLLPVVMFLGCATIGGLALFFGKRIWGPTSARAHILGFSCGSGNTGYYGLPLITAIFSGVGYAIGAEEAVSIAIFGLMGFVLYENTLGFYFVARSRHSMRESIRRVLRLPSVYAFALGVLLNAVGMESGGPWRDLAISYRGAYTIFGMMLVGVGLGQAKFEHWEPGFLSFALVAKLVGWPLLALAAISADNAWFRLFDTETHLVMFLLAVVPLPANAIAVATEFDCEAERIAVATLLSTLVALVAIPAWLMIYL